MNTDSSCPDPDCPEHGPMPPGAGGVGDLGAPVSLPDRSARRREAVSGAHSPSRSVAADVEIVLAAAHDPALGLDRSVCLRDVVEALRDMRLPRRGFAVGDEAADFIERKFTETPDV